MQFNQGPKSFEAGGTVSANRLVKLSSGKIVHNTATASDDLIGATLGYGVSGEVVAVDMINKSGTMQIEASGAISADAAVYADANGRVRALPAAAGTYRKVGIAIGAASGAGSIIEVLPYGYTITTTVS